MIRTSTGFLALAVLAASCAVSRADLIDYTETFSSSGTLGATSFTNEQITFSETADTDSLSVLDGHYTIGLTGVNVTIGGVGTVSLSDTVSEFDNQNTSYLGLVDRVTGGTISYQNTSVYNSYTLITPIGPVSGDSPSYEGNFATSSGYLHFTSPSGTSSFTASPAAVPEPSSSSVVLMAMGLCGVLSATRAARNRRARPLSSGPPENAFQGTNPDR